MQTNFAERASRDSVRRKRASSAAGALRRAADGAQIGNPLVLAPSGDYVLTVDADGDATGDYQFALQDLANATLLTPGSAVSSTLDPGNETDLYQFTSNAGDQFTFDSISRTG